MPVARSTRLHPLVMIVEEALGAVLAPGPRGAILEEALDTAGLEVMPDRALGMRIFLEGPLFSVLARHMAVPDALELLSQVRAALELALASVDDRPQSDVRERPTALRAGPSSALVVTSASVVVFLLADMLGDHADVLTASSSAELRQRLEADSPRLVVIDRRYPCVDLSICDTLLEQVASGGVVVWWGGPEAEQRTVSRALGHTLRVVTTAPELRLADLGALCRDLLET